MDLNMSFFLENGYPVIDEEISEKSIGDSFLTVINGELAHVTCNVFVNGKPACILTFPYDEYKIILFNEKLSDHSDFLKAIRNDLMTGKRAKINHE